MCIVDRARDTLPFRRGKNEIDVEPEDAIQIHAPVGQHRCDPAFHLFGEHGAQGEQTNERIRSGRRRVLVDVLVENLAHHAQQLAERERRRFIGKNRT